MWAKKEMNETERENLRHQLDALNSELMILEERAGAGKKEIENFMWERDLLNKDVVAAESQGKGKKNKLKTAENEKKKLQNKQNGYKTETDRLQ